MEAPGQHAGSHGPQQLEILQDHQALALLHISATAAH
jgi:hypothetical protein